ITITINGTNDAPAITSGIATVSEEGLPGGLKDDNGTSDKTDAKPFSGNLTISDTDTNDTHTVSLVKPADSVLTSHGQPVVWTLSDNGHTLTGAVGGVAVVTITITDAGAYTVTLAGQIDHPVKGVEDVLSLGVGVQV